MTEKELDDAHDVYMKLASDIEAFANREIHRLRLTPEAEDYVRTLLTETMRFWADV